MKICYLYLVIAAMLGFVAGQGGGGGGGGGGAGGSGGHKEHHEHYVDYHDHPHYHFHYDVHDTKHHDYHSQWEHRDGHKVQGEYSLVQPDGKVRTVKYEADKHGGFQAKVHYEGGHHHPHHFGGSGTGF